MIFLTPFLRNYFLGHFFFKTATKTISNKACAATCPKTFYAQKKIATAETLYSCMFQQMQKNK
jgi:hypothetical protein